MDGYGDLLRRAQEDRFVARVAIARVADEVVEREIDVYDFDGRFIEFYCRGNDTLGLLRFDQIRGVELLETRFEVDVLAAEEIRREREQILLQAQARPKPRSIAPPPMPKRRPAPRAWTVPVGVFAGLFLSLLAVSVLTGQKPAVLQVTGRSVKPSTPLPPDASGQDPHREPSTSVTP